MMYILIGLCAVSIVLNIVLVSYSTRLAHIANFWKDELKRETAAVRPVSVVRPVEIKQYKDPLPAIATDYAERSRNDWEADWKTGWDD